MEGMKTPSKKPKPQKSIEKRKNKKKYKVRNWREYNQSLVDRGKVLFWITEEAMKNWQEQEDTGKRRRGKPQQYSDLAITTALTLQQVFRLPLRQTEGFLASILGKLAPALESPDHSTLSLRGKTLAVAIRVRPLSSEPVHIVADSSGVKVYGEGEWKVRQHGWSKRRTWKKLHIGVDERTGDIMLGEVTGNETADCQMLAPLLDAVPASVSIDQVSADGAYDKRVCYEELMRRGIPSIAIPPQHNAKIWKHGNQGGVRMPRDENLRRIRAVGRKQWKEEAGYHRRSMAENAFFRLKTIFSDKVRSRTTSNQRTELLLRCRALNLMTTLGMPDTYLVA